VFFALLSSPFTHRSFFSAGLCGSDSVVVPATPFRRYGTLWWMTETKASQILLPLYEAVFQSFSMSPKHLESDTKGKRVHSGLHLGTRLLRSSWRRHPPCHGNKAKETGGGSKIAQNPYVWTKSSNLMQVNIKRRQTELTFKNKKQKVNFANFFVSFSIFQLNRYKLPYKFNKTWNLSCKIPLVITYVNPW
jgi:hypothetical protein